MWVACVGCTVVVAFVGIFGHAQFQVIAGWLLALVCFFRAGQCVVALRGADLHWGTMAALAAFGGAYLLLMDAGVRGFRDTIKKKQVS